MKTCPECGITLQDEFQFCPEDGASLDRSSQEAQNKTTPALPQPAPAVVLYCPACAAEYPLTFAECPVHHTALTRHAVVSRLDEPQTVEPQPEPHEPVEHQLPARHLHLVTADERPQAETTEGTARMSGMEAYEAALENLVTHPVHDEPSGHEPLPHDEPDHHEDATKYRTMAMVVGVGLVLLALVGAYVVFSNASRKPVRPAKGPVETKASAQQPVTVATPQAAIDYPDEGFANARVPVKPEVSKPTKSEATNEEQGRARRSAEEAVPPAPKIAERRPTASPREQIAAPTPRPAPVPAQPAQAQTAMVRQPAATELVMPRGTFGQVAARLTGVRASRTMGGYRYELTFHLADQIGQTTQWERLAIVTRTMSGATRQQQIPFYHRLGADGTMSFTVSVEMPGRAPADWQGRIICTSIGSDSRGRVHRASFGANVSPN